MPEKVTSVGSINSFKNAYDDFISKWYKLNEHSSLLSQLFEPQSRRHPHYPASAGNCHKKK